MARPEHRLVRAAAALLALALLLLAGVRPATARVVDAAAPCCCPPGAHGADHASAARAELHRACACEIAPNDAPHTAPSSMPTAPTVRDSAIPLAPAARVLPVVARAHAAAAARPGPWTPPPRSLYALRTLLTV